jgi:cytochrome subunit of sulfide dehydrogenase
MKSFLRFDGRFLVGALLSVMSVSSLLAQEATLSTKLLASNCANCHGTNGNAAAGSVVPGLAGYSRETFIANMTAYKRGEKPATIMHQISKGYSDQQIVDLANYFAAQKKN